MGADKKTVKKVQRSISQPLVMAYLADTVGLFASHRAKTILCQPGINNTVLIVLSKLI